MPDLDAIRQDLQKLYDDGFRALALVFAHSYTYPEHEQRVGALAREMGFTHVSESAALLPMIKLVPRGVSCTADAYLTPVLRTYLDGFFDGFDPKLRKGEGARVEFMGSDGGLLDLRNFSGLKSILSGPAGGVVGYALTSWDEEARHPVIGCDLYLLSRNAYANYHHLDSTSAGPRRTSPASPDVTRSSTRPRPQAFPFSRHSSISTPSPQAGVAAYHSATVYSWQDRKVRARSPGRRVIGASSFLPSYLCPYKDSC